MVYVVYVPCLGLRMCSVVALVLTSQQHCRRHGRRDKLCLPVGEGAGGGGALPKQQVRWCRMEHSMGMIGWA